ncbi:hypothetical protein HOY82DRAFT_550953 [Tuber indicum]|nr:hypothetical protein HOY82DRAFT_550953 [Tuber indicum]
MKALLPLLSVLLTFLLLKPAESIPSRTPPPPTTETTYATIDHPKGICNPLVGKLLCNTLGKCCPPVCTHTGSPCDLANPGTCCSLGCTRKAEVSICL